MINLQTIATVGLGFAVVFLYGGSLFRGSFKGGGDKKYLPLYLEPHNTTSVPSLNYTIAKEVAPSLRYHLLRDPLLYCLCMHHLKTSSQYERVCAVYNRETEPPQFYVLVNMILTGGSRQDTLAYKEQSVACAGPPKSRYRMRHAFFDWYDPFLQVQMYRRFSDNTAACLQLAIDEIKGNKSLYC